MAALMLRVAMTLISLGDPLAAPMTFKTASVPRTVSSTRAWSVKSPWMTSRLALCVLSLAGLRTSAFTA